MMKPSMDASTRTDFNLSVSCRGSRAVSAVWSDLASIAGICLLLFIGMASTAGCSADKDDTTTSEKLPAAGGTGVDPAGVEKEAVPASTSSGKPTKNAAPTSIDEAKRLKNDGSFFLSSGDFLGAIQAFDASKAAGGDPAELDPLIEQCKAKQVEKERKVLQEEERRRAAEAKRLREEEERRKEKERQAQSGAFTARSSRSGVEVHMDGTRVGLTPVTVHEVPQGQHTLEWYVNGHIVCTRSFQMRGNTEHAFDCLAPNHIYRARLSYRDHHNSKGVRLKSADGIIRQDRAWVHRYDKTDPEDDLDPVFDGIKMRGQMEDLLAGSLSRSDKSRILDTNPLIEVWIWEHKLDVHFVD